MATDKQASKYQKKIEESLTQYVAQNIMSLSEAHEYMIKLTETIFGNDLHSGIYEYITSNFKELELKGDELIAKCEDLYSKGWRVINKEGKFYLVDDHLRVISDVTGPQTVMEPEEELVPLDLSQETTYLFINTKEASQLVSEGMKYNIDPTMFKGASFTYKFVYDKTGGAESRLFPFAQSYRDMSTIMSKMAYFPYVNGIEFMDIQELYGQGFKISNEVINPTDFPRASLTTANKKLVLTPVRADTLGKFKVDQLALILGVKRKEAFTKLAVEVELPIQVGEKGQTFALAFEDKRNYTQVQDLGEVIRIIDAIALSHRTKSFPTQNYKKIIGDLCAIYIIDALLLGNGSFSLADVTLDTVTPQVYLRYSGKVTSKTPLEVIKILNTMNPTSSEDISKVLTGNLSLDSKNIRENLSVIFANVPEGFKSVLQSIDVSDLPKGFDQVKDRLTKVIK